MSSDIWAFCDLDDTLFATGRKVPEALRARTAALDQGGEPHSFLTRPQVTLLDRLLQDATLIPVTGRDPEAFARLHLPLSSRFTSWAILDHGASVRRPGGQPDRVWANVMQDELESHAEALLLAYQTAQHINELGYLGLSVRLHRLAGSSGEAQHGPPLMVVIKHPYGLQGSLDGFAEQWREWNAEVGLRLRYFANGNNLTLIAPSVSKEAAVEYVMGQLESENGSAVLTLGLGDSLADAPFMALCDFALTPGQGQLMRAVLEHPLEQR
jgi:hydroxymethylpyrimidine pyrophosphatase-like HAD family hydrolase